MIYCSWVCPGMFLYRELGISVAIDVYHAVTLILHVADWGSSFMDVACHLFFVCVVSLILNLLHVLCHVQTN